MRRVADRFNRIPVRWRLALTSAGLTFAILTSFAVVIGWVAEHRMRGDFDSDLRARAADVQENLRVRETPLGPRLVASRNLFEVARAGGATFRTVRADGVVIGPEGAPDLGPVRPGPRDVGAYRVVSRPLFTSTRERPVAYVQYAKPRESLRATISRLRLFLFLGGLCGTALALLAGLAVARRAMGPVATLTASAKEIARTRDPGVRLPEPEAEDEVADLSRTLAEMLQALGASRAETEAALTRQREFVADASHELRTPLTSVLANLEMLEDELRGEQHDMAASALRSSQRMRRLVADLLLLARADAGHYGLRVPTDVGLVVREAAAEARALAEGHEVIVDAPEGCVVDGAPDDLHRVALNLIQNAIVHTPPGTRVWASVRRQPGSVVIDVSDDGPGIPPELRHRAFDRFVRHAGDGGGGSGLGLAIVRAVAESHGGGVDLLDGPGAHFVVTLPATEPVPAEAAPVVS